MIKTIDFKIPELNIMKKYPKDIFYIGDSELLKRKKISIVGSRRPNQYAKQLTHALALKLSKRQICIVSGGAMGVDAIAHRASGANNTIMIAGTGLDTRYPAVNKNLIIEIEKSGLVLSQFKEKTSARTYNFPLRNEMIVALGDALIVTYADLKSGSMRSVEYAIKMGKKIYVLPHRLDESKGTNELLKKGLASAIYDIDDFIDSLGGAGASSEIKDDFLEYCKKNPTYDEAISKYNSKVFEYELMGKIEIKDGKVYSI